MNENLLISILERLCNFIELSGVIVMLFIALTFQILFHELPCPLCLLQRLGFFGVAMGFLLNLRFGLRPSHYAIVILSALFTSFVALRQIALHVVPGTGTFGDAFLGLHLYTWSFVVSMIILVVTACLLSIDRQYRTTDLPISGFRLLTSLLFVILLILVGMNIATVLLQCGITLCPDNPTQYFFPFKF
jgi:disulfide bond formation protein DsbB